MEHQNLICKLKLKPGQTYAHIMDMKDKGGRFVMFIQLTAIPPLFVISRPTPLFFLEPEEDIKPLRQTYLRRNIIMAFLGPFNGFLEMAKAGTLNASDVDLTHDVYANLNETDFEAGIVVLKKTGSNWRKPTASVSAGVQTCMSRLEKQRLFFRHPVRVGQMTGEHSADYIIGLQAEDYVLADALQTQVAKEFYKHVRIRIVNLNAPGMEETAAGLEQYGITLPPQR